MRSGVPCTRVCSDEGIRKRVRGLLVAAENKIKAPESPKAAITMKLRSKHCLHYLVFPPVKTIFSVTAEMISIGIYTAICCQIKLFSLLSL